MDAAQLRTFGTKYAAAWCSQEAARVAALYAENASLTINEGTPCWANSHHRRSSGLHDRPPGHGR
jgi:hypothetical protein